jgi:hypothetical protein
VLELSRFLLAVAGCFVAGFFAINWFQAGGPLPIPAVTVRPLQASPSIPTFEQSVAQSRNQASLEQQTSQSDRDPDRDALRLAALQASNAFAQSPCDATMKANLIKALTAYTTAWAEKAGCTARGCPNNARADLAFEMFNTPLDKRVSEAAQAAFAKGGITNAEFPAKVWLPLLTVTRSDGDPVSACSPARANSTPSSKRSQR